MQELAHVYGAVIDDVCTKVRSEFIQEGNEPVLEELRLLWEEKLVQSGVLEIPSANDVDNQPPLGSASLMNAGPFLAQASLPQQGMPQTMHSVQRVTNANAYQPRLSNLNHYGQSVQPLQHPMALAQGPGLPAIGQPQPHLSSNQAANRYFTAHPVSHAVSSAPLGESAGVQYPYANTQSQASQWPMHNTVDSRKRKAELTQVPYGAFPLEPPHKQERLMGAQAGPPQLPAHTAASPAIPQRDGPGDDAPSPGAVQEEESLDNLSDVELEDDAGDDKDLLPNYVLGQYELVKRTKTKWKITLNHAVMHLNGQDIVVSKANGEFDF